ncbi:hypothetical protein [Pseudoalteromonas maricaloris]|uniref:hypothetical protein n=1 Tax=Pseudoalteromonas maricaloris TaxID=184924 RepID=UPI003C2034DC
MAHDNKKVVLKGQAAIELWLQGKEAWNKWVEENPVADVSFREVDFTKFEGVLFTGYKFPTGTVDFSLARFNEDRAICPNKQLANIQVNFSHAHFGDGDVDFSGAMFGISDVLFLQTQFGAGRVSFSGVTLAKGLVNFSNAHFGDGNVNFSGSRFNKAEVLFLNTQFGNGDIDFFDARFVGDVFFSGSKFDNGDVTFNRARFSNGNISFASTQFEKGNVRFIDTDFGDGNVRFSFTQFGDGHVSFYEAKLRGNITHFDNAKFGKGYVNFSRAIFGGGDIDFSRTDFGEGSVNFSFSIFNQGEVSFSSSKVTGNFGFANIDGADKIRSLSFKHATFDGSVDLDNNNFNCVPDFTNTKLSHQLNLSHFTVIPRTKNKDKLASKLFIGLKKLGLAKS